ncbi:3-isopropylmalate dehydrogenase [Pseudozobellia thermophila]|uniref:3-isopropylmalate dehydrogenase n=1 Tax=Pseudozobellia thermophila TaxID=192903 RepID=A0A1M6F5S0_9FLAO|nr:3-isopropylmalate dehydrogenase [Pseudozobellia thermophila]SHI93047.1 3-isopropylmalate dehydrogenase [Pseudozobellia thermophila]
MQLKIALLGGDGIGPEVLAQSVKCLKAIEETFNHSFEYVEASVGAVAISNTGKPLPDATLKLCREADAILFGAIGSLEYDNNPDAQVRPEQGLLGLRKELGLFANIRPVKMFDSLIANSPLKEHIVRGTDLVIFRELTGGIYFGKKSISEDGTRASDVCEYTEDEIGRVTHLAFKAAKKRRKKLTLVDKANVLESSRLWRKTVSEIAKSYPDVELQTMFIDNAAVQMMMNPTQFDVILTDNMFGDILSDQGSVIIGSVGLLPSASIGRENAMFEPFHGSYPQAKGKNIANPVASILSTAMLLQHYGLNEEANAIVSAVNESFIKKVVTLDVLGSSKYGTDYVGDFISEHIVDPDENLNINDENIGLGKSTII